MMDPFLSQTASHPQEYVVADTAFEKSLEKYKPDAKNGFGERGRNRTCDPRIKSAMLYRLSYALTYIKFNTVQSAAFACGVPRRCARGQMTCVSLVRTL